jgi:hypothetical protein
VKLEARAVSEIDTTKGVSRRMNDYLIGGCFP